MKRRFPFSPNPVGWFVVACSAELPQKGVLPVSYLGDEFVVFRTEAGRPRVLDAYCPHLGAHLGHGGVVQGDSIRCPFHAWCFSGDGDCTSVPYAKKIPKNARVRSWPVCEVNGFVFVYFHPAGEAPGWDVPRLPEFGAEEWTPYAQRRWKIRTNIHEMVENAFDRAHFRYLHGTRDIPEPEHRFDGPLFRLKSKTVLDTPVGTMDGLLDIHSLGFGFGTARFTGLIETLLITAITPIDDEYVDARFTFTVKKLPDENATRFVGEGFIEELSRQVEQDIPIWEHKAYLERPLLCDGDGPIGPFRKWARQFYPASGEPPAAG